MILGLDVSTSIVGFCILDKSANIIYCDHIDMRKEKNFFKKAALIEERLYHLNKNYEIEEVYIEQSLQSFRTGFSSAQTLSLLSKINGIVSWQCFKILGKEPEYLAAVSARKLVGIKVPKGMKAKKVVIQFLVDNVPGFEVEYTRYNNPKAGWYDRADSYVIAKAGLISEAKKT